MAILTSAFSYLGSYYSEANPSLQGLLNLLFMFVRRVNRALPDRAESFHKGRLQLACQHGQADIQAHWQSNYARRVSRCTRYYELGLLILLSTYYHWRSMAYRVRQGRDFVTPPTGLSYTGSYVIFIFAILADLFLTPVFALS